MNRMTHSDLDRTPIVRGPLRARLLAGVIVLLGSAGVAAQDNGGAATETDADDAIFYSGIIAQRMDVDFANIEAPINLGFRGGVTVPGLTWLGAEFAGSFSVIPGENRGGSGGLIGGGGGGGSGSPCPDPTGLTCPPEEPPSQPTTASSEDLQLFDLGLYLVGRTPGRFYGHGRIGYRYLQSNLDEVTRDDRSGTAFAGGLGYRYGKGLGGIELSYGRLSDTIDYIGLSLTYDFASSAERRKRGRDRRRDD
jgi:hypothetical protein